MMLILFLFIIGSVIFCPSVLYTAITPKEEHKTFITMAVIGFLLMLPLLIKIITIN